jgi:hypothetical protein
MNIEKFDDELFDEPENEEEVDDFGGLEYGDEEFDDLQRNMNLKKVIKHLKPQEGTWSKWKEEKPFNPIKSDDLPLEKYLKFKEMKSKQVKESQLKSIIRKVLKEEEHENYMFFSNLEQMKRQCEILLNEFEPHFIDEVLSGGHDWAADHVSEAKNNLDQVFDFMMNEKKQNQMTIEEGKEITEKQKKNKPTNPQLWQQSLSWAKSRYKVCPSAYCNGAAAKRYKSKGGKWKRK